MNTTDVSYYCDLEDHILTYQIVAIATRVSLIAADIIVIIVTWRKIFRHTQEAQGVAAESNVSDVLLRDGELVPAYAARFS